MVNCQVLSLAVGWRLMNNQAKIDKAIELIKEDGCVCGSHHKAWVIDQLLRILAEDQYESIVAEYTNGDRGPDTYVWDVGCPP